jgi:hypothetical protein
MKSSTGPREIGLKFETTFDYFCYTGRTAVSGEFLFR